MSHIDRDYECLLHDLLSGALSAADFQRTYMARFKDECRTLDDAVFAILDELFGDVDAFCTDPVLLAELMSTKPGFYLDEQVLRAKGTLALQRLARLQQQARS